MAELILKERLQPALLDRLTDNEPEKLMESREQRVISLAKLRQSILRDLSWLLNAVRLDATQDLSDLPWVQQSVLNYGLPSFTGASIALLSVVETEMAIKEVILRFEPRLLASSVKVKLIESSLREDAHNTIALEIEADLWCQPMPLHMFMKTELDLEIGTARLTELSESEIARPDRPRVRRR
jgi:type VI secretion system protein ImpF